MSRRVKSQESLWGLLKESLWGALKEGLFNIVGNILGLLILLLVIVVIAVPILFFASLCEGPPSATVYFDNGAEEAYNLFIDGKEVDMVRSQSLTIVKIETGEHLVELKRDNGELFESQTISCEQISYIYNVGELNEYFIETHVYGNPPSDFVLPPPERLEIGNTFFEMPEVNYELGEYVPSSIAIHPSSTYVVMTSLVSRRR